MVEVVEIPVELTQFQLPQAVQDRLHLLLDRQDKGGLYHRFGHLWSSSG